VYRSRKSKKEAKAQQRIKKNVEKIPITTPGTHRG
jgi:hypothetical protein